MRSNVHSIICIPTVERGKVHLHGNCLITLYFLLLTRSKEKLGLIVWIVSQKMCTESDEENELKGKEEIRNGLLFCRLWRNHTLWILFDSNSTNKRVWGQITPHWSLDREKSSDNTSVRVWMIGVVCDPLFNFHLMHIVVCCFKHFATLNRIPLWFGKVVRITHRKSKERKTYFLTIVFFRYVCTFSIFGQEWVSNFSTRIHNTFSHSISKGARIYSIFGCCASFSNFNRTNDFQYVTKCTVS